MLPEGVGGMRVQNFEKKKTQYFQYESISDPYLPIHLSGKENGTFDQKQGHVL